MTREEAKRRMEICRDFLANNYSDMGEPNFTAFNMAIKALSQEPCDDAISRDAVLSKINEVCFSKEWTRFRIDNGSNGQRDFLINYIEQLPPVTPQEPKSYL